MEIPIDNLNETRRRSLQRLSSFQNHQIMGNILYYQVESHISLKQLWEGKLIKFFSLGQITIIIYNSVEHLLKIQQNIDLSTLNEENIYINQELNVIFTNIHDETHDYSPYKQNIISLIKIFYKLLTQYSELIKQQKNYDNLLTHKMVTIYSNKILELLKSDNHLKNLKQFIQEYIKDQKIIDIFLNDQVINRQQFDQIFKQQSDIGYNFYEKQSESDINNQFSIPSEITAKQQLQFQQQNSIRQCQEPTFSVSSNESNIQYKVEGTVYSLGSQQHEQKSELSNGSEQAKDLRNPISTLLPFQNQNFINNQVQSEIVQSEETIYVKQRSSSGKKNSHDLIIQQKQVDLQSQNELSEQQSKPQKSRLCKSTESNSSQVVKVHSKVQMETFTEDQKIIIDYFNNQTSQISDKLFRENLIQFLTKNYCDMRIEQAKCCILNVMCYYYHFLQFSIQIQDSSISSKSKVSFKEYGLERLLNLFSAKMTSQEAQPELLLLQQQSGLNICNQQFNQWIIDYNT